MADQPLKIITDSGGDTGDPKRRAVSAKLRSLHDAEWKRCAEDFFYWLQFVYTDNEEDETIEQAPIHCDNLRFLYQQITEKRKVIFLKSRRQWISWLCSLRLMHRAMFANTGMPDTPDSYFGAIFSIDEDSAVYLMARPYVVYQRFPDWMKRRNPLITDNKMYCEFQRGGKIKAFPLKRSGPRSFGFSECLFDEMAFQEAVRGVWRGLVPTLGQKGIVMAVSTPNGRGNLFANVWFNKNERYKAFSRLQVEWNGVTTIDPGTSRQEVYRPEKALHGLDWYKAMENQMEAPDFAREVLLSFVMQEGDPVWAQFDQNTHCFKPDEAEIDKTRPVLIGWDFGYHFPASTLWQRNNKDQYIGYFEKQGYDQDFNEFATECKEFYASKIDIYKQPIIHYVDPAGFQRYHARSKSGAANDIGELRQVFGQNARIYPGINEVGNRANEGPRLKEVRKLWKLRKDGRPSIAFSEGMDLFLEGCQGGYAYPEKGGEQPDKGEHSHTQDTLQMIVTGHNRSMLAGPTQAQDEEPKKRIGLRTGL